MLSSRHALSGGHWAVFMRRGPVRAVGPPNPRCYAVDRASAGPHAAHKREGGPCPAAPDAKAGGATNVRAASRVALADTEVSTGGVGLTAGWGSPAIGVFLHQSFAHGAPCFPVPTVAADKHYPHGRCCTPRQTLGLSADLCVRCFQPSLSLRSCSSFVCCSASLCISCAVAVLFCLRTCVLLCPRISLLGPPLRGWCRQRGFA